MTELELWLQNLRCSAQLASNEMAATSATQLASASVRPTVQALCQLISNVKVFVKVVWQVHVTSELCSYIASASWQFVFAALQAARRFLVACETAA